MTPPFIDLETESVLPNRRAGRGSLRRPLRAPLFGLIAAAGVIDCVPAPPPPNDDCGNAVPVFPGDQLTGTVIGGTHDGESFCDSPFGFDNPDVWYTFTAPTDGTLLATTCGTNDMPGVDQGMDTVLSVHGGLGCPGTTFNMLVCDNDNGPFQALCSGLDAGNVGDSAVVLDMTTGQTVLIRVSRS